MFTGSKTLMGAELVTAIKRRNLFEIWRDGSSADIFRDRFHPPAELSSRETHSRIIGALEKFAKAIWRDAAETN